jgi:hypothetical protein
MNLGQSVTYVPGYTNRRPFLYRTLDRKENRLKKVMASKSARRSPVSANLGNTNRIISGIAIAVPVFMFRSIGRIAVLWQPPTAWLHFRSDPGDGGDSRHFSHRRLLSMTKFGSPPPQTDSVLRRSGHPKFL